MPQAIAISTRSQTCRRRLTTWAGGRAAMPSTARTAPPTDTSSSAMPKSETNEVHAGQGRVVQRLRREGNACDASLRPDGRLPVNEV
eukprot:8722203-Pyramimonas_sp.AAC.1